MRKKMNDDELTIYDVKRGIFAKESNDDATTDD